MIAQLPTVKPTAQYPEFLDALRASGFRGQLSADYATRTVLATRWPSLSKQGDHAFR